MKDSEILEGLRRAAVWFEPAADGFALLLDRIGEANPSC